MQSLNLAKAVVEHGWAHIPNGRGDLDILEVASELGSPVSPGRRAVVQPLVARSQGLAPKHSLSGIHGLGEFPAHTDVAHWPKPARYVVLQCLANEPRVPTVLLDGKDLIDEALTRSWSSAVWKTVNVPRPFCCSVLFRGRGGYALRWDPGCMVPMGGRAHEVSEQLTDALHQSLRDQGEEVVLREGDLVAIDNWRVLHRRPSVPEGKLRILNRVLVSEGRR